MNSDKLFTHVFYVCILVLLGMLVYSNAIDGGFIYDDYAFIVNNPYIKHLTGNFFKFFVQPDTISADTHLVYRPLRTITYAFDFLMWRNNPKGYHLTNLILHLFNTIGFYFLYLVFFNFGQQSERNRMKMAAFASALLWCLHPLNTETVNWVSARSDLLSCCFIVFSFIGYLLSVQSMRQKSRRWYVVSVFLYVLALFSKESSVVLIFIIVIYDLLIRSLSFKSTVKRWVVYLPYFICSLFFFAIRSFVVGSLAQRGWWGGSVWTNGFTMLKVFLTYLRLLFVPVRLSFLYDVDVVQNILSSEVVLTVLLWAVCLLCFWFLHRASRIYSFSLSWFFVFLLPVSNIIPIRGLIQEHYLYVSSFAWAFAVSYFLFFHIRRFKVPSAVSPLIVFLIVCVFSYMTFSRNVVWGSDFALWQDTVRKSPCSFIARDGLAHAYYGRGELEQAYQQLQKAVELRPDYARAYAKMGLIAYQKGDEKEAIRYNNKALSIDSSLAEAYHNLGFIYQRRQEYDKAAVLYRKALDIDPGIEVIYIRLIALYKKAGDEKMAQEMFNKLKRIDPSVPVGLK